MGIDRGEEVPAVMSANTRRCNRRITLIDLNQKFVRCEDTDLRDLKRICEQDGISDDAASRAGLSKSETTIASEQDNVVLSDRMVETIRRECGQPPVLTADHKMALRSRGP